MRQHHGCVLHSEGRTQADRRREVFLDRGPFHSPHSGGGGLPWQKAPRRLVLQGRPRGRAQRSQAHASGCGRRGRCAPNRSPSRASMTPCAVGAPSLVLRARLPSPDPLTPCSRTRRRTADGSRTAEIASHGRLTACRSRLTGYPDRAYDRRASLFFRRGALCMLACVVQGSCVHIVGFRRSVLQCASYVDRSLG